MAGILNLRPSIGLGPCAVVAENETEWNACAQARLEVTVPFFPFFNNPPHFGFYIYDSFTFDFKNSYGLGGTFHLYTDPGARRGFSSAIELDFGARDSSQFETRVAYAQLVGPENKGFPMHLVISAAYAAGDSKNVDVLPESLFTAAFKVSF